MTLRRAIVQGWDSGTSQPKGVSTAVDVRQSVSPLAARAGVFRTADDACAASGTGTMDVELQPFTVAIESTLGGFYIVVEDDVAAVELDPADSTNDRIDVIYVIQNDYQVDAGEVDSTVEYGVATGTPGVTPTAPTVPTGAYALWECEVPANATDTLDGVVFTPVFVWTAPVGAVMPVRDSSDLASWTPANGSEADQLDTGVTYRRISGAWKAWDSGWIAYTPASATITVGVGSKIEEYRWVGGRVYVHLCYIIGSGGNITGDLVVSLPFNRVPLRHAYERYEKTDAGVFDLSVTTNYDKISVIADNTSVSAVRLGYGAAGSVTAFVSATTPIAINSGDVYEWFFFYDPA